MVAVLGGDDTLKATGVREEGTGVSGSDPQIRLHSRKKGNSAHLEERDTWAGWRPVDGERPSDGSETRHTDRGTERQEGAWRWSAGSGPGPGGSWAAGDAEALAGVRAPEGSGAPVSFSALALGGSWLLSEVTSDSTPPALVLRIWARRAPNRATGHLRGEEARTDGGKQARGSAARLGLSSRGSAGARRSARCASSSASTLKGNGPGSARSPPHVLSPEGFMTSGAGAMRGRRARSPAA